MKKHEETLGSLEHIVLLAVMRSRGKRLRDH